jgi:transposase InsO family protein
MDLLCERLGIERQKSEPYNQASNGKAERAIRTVMDLARTILLASGLPITFWGDAVLYACYILNRVLTRANEGSKSPLEAATGEVQFIGDLVPFGAKCTVLVSHKYGKGK